MIRRKQRIAMRDLGTLNAEDAGIATKNRVGWLNVVLTIGQYNLVSWGRATSCTIPSAIFLLSPVCQKLVVCAPANRTSRGHGVLLAHNSRPRQIFPCRRFCSNNQKDVS